MGDKLFNILDEQLRSNLQVVTADVDRLEIFAKRVAERVDLTIDVINKSVLKVDENRDSSIKQLVQNNEILSQKNNELCNLLVVKDEELLYCKQNIALLEQKCQEIGSIKHICDKIEHHSNEIGGLNERLNEKSLTLKAEESISCQTELQWNVPDKECDCTEISPELLSPSQYSKVISLIKRTMEMWIDRVVINDAYLVIINILDNISSKETVQQEIDLNSYQVRNDQLIFENRCLLNNKIMYQKLISTNEAMQEQIKIYIEEKYNKLEMEVIQLENRALKENANQSKHLRDEETQTNMIVKLEPSELCESNNESPVDTIKKQVNWPENIANIQNISIHPTKCSSIFNDSNVQFDSCISDNPHKLVGVNCLNESDTTMLNDIPKSTIDMKSIRSQIKQSRKSGRLKRIR